MGASAPDARHSGTVQGRAAGTSAAAARFQAKELHHARFDGLFRRSRNRGRRDRRRYRRRTAVRGHRQPENSQAGADPAGTAHVGATDSGESRDVGTRGESGRAAVVCHSPRAPTVPHRRSPKRQSAKPAPAATLAAARPLFRPHPSPPFPPLHRQPRTSPPNRSRRLLQTTRSPGRRTSTSSEPRRRNDVASVGSNGPKSAVISRVTRTRSCARSRTKVREETGIEGRCLPRAGTRRGTPNPFVRSRLIGLHRQIS